MKIPLTPDKRVQHYRELCERILLDIDDLPERAEEFAMSCEVTISSILTFIEEQGRVTDKQAEAIENIESGVNRWFR